MKFLINNTQPKSVSLHKRVKLRCKVKAALILSGVLLSSVLTIGCGDSRSDEKKIIEPPVTTNSEVQLGDGDDARLISFSTPENTVGTNTEDTAILALPRQISDDQSLLSQSASSFPYEDMWKYSELIPTPDLYCQAPSNADYQSLSEKMGGFNKSHRVTIESDATSPTFIHGFNPWFNLEYAVDASVGGESVEISRPDLVAQKGDMAFFMSNVYGLIYVDNSPMPSSAATTSCGMPIPGTPKNFLVLDDHLLVLTQSHDQLHSAVVKFALSNNQPEFVDALILENKHIIDARLFNQTTALYLKAYEPDVGFDPQTEITQSQAKSTSDFFWAPIFSPEETHRELTILNSANEITVEHNDILNKQGYESEYDYQGYDPEEDRHWSYFNDFLSASGEYLIVTETVRESKFSHYQSKSYQQCQHWSSYEQPYKYCQTQWKRIENPDYKPLPSSGLISCGNDLFSCINTQLPTVSRYIYVADGEECTEGTRTISQCNNYQTQYYNVAQYDRYNYSNFIVYRFEEGNFTRLDDTLVSVNQADNTLTTTDEPFRINGIIEKHDHMSFNDGVFYVINQDEANNQQQLSTFAIYGNSAASVDNLLLVDGNSYNSSAFFTDDKVFISKETGNNLSYDQSVLQTVSLAQPFSPVAVSDLTIPTEISQMTFLDDSLVGIGKTYVDFGTTSRVFGTAIAFDVPANGGETTETNSFILGADYQYYYSAISNDDQVLHIDHQLNRLLVPYRARNPINQTTPGNNVTRLSMFDLINGELSEQHTFDLPKVTKRSLSLSENTALAFNDEEIYSLANNDSWQVNTIFSGALPDSIYYLHDTDAQVRIYEQNDRYVLNLDSYNTEQNVEEAAIASLELSKPTSTTCINKNLYFDTNRVIYVTEKTDTYYNYQDCPTDKANVELNIVGYDINAQGYQEIKDDEKLARLYQQIIWDMHCVVDFESDNYYQYETAPATDEEMNCYTYEQYNALLEQRNDQ